MSIAESVRVIAEWPEVAEGLESAREACTALRWHEALRRRIPEAAAESRVRGAHATADADGARFDMSVIRDLMRGAVEWPERPDPVDLIVQGAVQATAETEHLGPTLARAPRQVLARLHVAAATPLLPPDQVGRPRGRGEICQEFLDLGPAPEAVDARLGGVVELMSDPKLPAVLVASLVHAEIASARPFVRGNGLVARAVERMILHSRGLDPTGVSVPEYGHAKRAGAAYLGALTAYGTGTREGLVVWMRHCTDSIVDGAAQGTRIADAVRVGRLN